MPPDHLLGGFPTIPSPFSGLDTVILRVGAISAATAWYVQHLGAEVVYEDEAQRLPVLEFGGDPEGSGAGSPLTLEGGENTV